MTDNSGLKVGLGITALGMGGLYSIKPISKKIYKMAVDYARKNLPAEDAYVTTKPIFEANKALKNIKVTKPLMIAIPLYMGCGAIVDWFNKKQRTETEPNATTKKGNAYTKVNMGKKLGAALGVAGYAISGLINLPEMKKMLAASPNKAVTVGTSIAIGAIGGYLLGALTDKISNKKAAEAADKAAA